VIRPGARTQGGLPALRGRIDRTTINRTTTDDPQADVAAVVTEPRPRGLDEVRAVWTVRAGMFG
jgi:hypothetical protein